MQVPNTVSFAITQFELQGEDMGIRLDLRVTITQAQRVALAPVDGWLPTDEELSQAIKDAAALTKEILPEEIRAALEHIQHQTRIDELHAEQESIDAELDQEQ